METCSADKSVPREVDTLLSGKRVVLLSITHKSEALLDRIPDKVAVNCRQDAKTKVG
jgi:hypothetical protein